MNKAKRMHEDEAMNEFAQELLRNGFRVWRSPQKWPFLFAADAGRAEHLGYVCRAPGSGGGYSTVHVPSLSLGTGFLFEEGPLDVEAMRRCCQCRVPAWWRGGTVDVKPWRDLGRWLKSACELVEVTSTAVSQEPEAEGAD